MWMAAQKALVRETSAATILLLCVYSASEKWGIDFIRNKF